MSGAEVQALIERLRHPEIEDAFHYCVEHDAWPEGFLPFDAIRDLRTLCQIAADALGGFQRAIVAHHNIANLSERVLADWAAQYRSGCPVCQEANVQNTTTQQRGEV